ncbi:MAG TPA: hypothetical protein VHL12_01965 [Gemmatimonadaceae bacterium]|jgi:hypothetical protein|nr:hypothetical protein [Gemmatimonadaceae bacterium]
MNLQPQKSQPQPLRAVCVARHSFLTAHLARYFASLGVVTSEMVGLVQRDDAEGTAADVVICDYDLLTALPLHKWEQHPLLSKTPVVAVSLTRKSQELHLTEVDGIAGFLYLPTLEPGQALQILRAATSRPKYSLPMNAATTTVEPS